MRRHLFAVLLGLTSLAASAAPRLMESRDLFKTHWANDVAISRDGSQVAYARNFNDIMTDQVLQTLWLIDTTNGTQRPITSELGHYGSPRWSPDGNQVAYLAADANGHTQIVIHGVRGDTAVLTHLTETPTDIAWSPDGKQIAFVMLDPTAGPSLGQALEKPAGATWAEGPVVIDRLNFRADGQGLDRTGFRHVYVVSTDGGGTPRPLTSGPYSDAGPLAWSNDGRSIYFAGNRNPDWMRDPEDWGRHTSMVLSIYKVDLADGALVHLSHEVGPYHAPTVSPDGKLIAYLGYNDRHIANQNARVTVMDADGSHPRVIGTNLDRSIMAAHWAADSRSLYVQYVDQAITKVARMSLDGQIEPIADHLADGEGPVQLPYTGGEFAVAEEGTVAYIGGNPDHLPEVFVTRAGKSRRLTNLNAELLTDVTIGKLSVLPVNSSFDGHPIDAWELLPPNFDPKKKYPLILEIHGGPYLSYGPVFSTEYQLYAAAGYIVVYGNPRGSNSYGEEFANLIYNNYPSHDYDDLMSIVDAAIARGNVDTENLFVTGSSGGGVLTSWIVGKTHRFRAAVTQRPVINWTSWMLTADMGSFGARYWFKKLPWEDQETYWKLSPLSLVGNVTTPTMVLVGLSDLRTTVSEAEQYYQALQLRGIPTELYEIPGAAHVAIRPSQLAQAQSAIVQWFDRYRTEARH